MIMSREAYEWAGELVGDNRKPLPKNVAYLYKDDSYYFGNDWQWNIKTWDEIHAERRKKQRIQMELIRRPETEINPCFVWVFYNSSWIFGGWYLYVLTLKKNYPIGFRGDNKQLIIKIMELYPCGILPLKENFDEWAIEFEKVYHREAFKRTKQGLVRAYVKIQNGSLVEIIKAK